MSLVINTNVSALNAYRNLSNNQSMMSDAIEKVSSGLRITASRSNLTDADLATEVTSMTQAQILTRSSTPA